MKRLCVFCGSSQGRRPAFRDAARDLGLELVRRDLTLVYGGGCVGLMGHLADTVLEHGGRVIGVIPRALKEREVAHGGLTELHVVESMHERKALMAELSDGFVALPGGIGTFEEFFEIVTWAQLGIHRKPCALLNVEGFYDPMISMLDQAIEEQFVRPQHRGLVIDSTTIAGLFEGFAAYRPPSLHKWIDRDET